MPTPSLFLIHYYTIYPLSSIGSSTSSKSYANTPIPSSSFLYLLVNLILLYVRVSYERSRYAAFKAKERKKKKKNQLNNIRIDGGTFNYNPTFVKWNKIKVRNLDGCYVLFFFLCLIEFSNLQKEKKNKASFLVRDHYILGLNKNCKLIC